MQSQQSKITLKGSCETVSEYFFYSINSILFQRGIYPSDSFDREQKYGITLLVTTNKPLQDYLARVMKQIKEWLAKKMIQKLVLVIKEIETQQVLERWQFDVDCNKELLAKCNALNDDAKEIPSSKSADDVNKEIREVMRQICACVTFLPCLPTRCSFDVLIYTDKDLEVPCEWGETGAQFIDNSVEVRLKSFSTAIHKVDTVVCYKDGL